jgi:hypothetical protein
MEKKAKSLWDQWEYEKFFDYHYFARPINPWPKDEMWEKLNRGDLPYSFQRSRGYMLKNLGAKPTFGAENVVVDGCANIFGSGFEGIGPYFQLLNALGIKYNLLPTKYCCGFFILARATPDEWEDALSKVKSLAERNIAEARELGARNVYQFCHLCTVMTQYADTKGTGMTQGYGLDILIEPMKKVKKLKVKTAKVGYYRGCWSRKKALNPNFKLNFDTYRTWVDRIEGLEVTDLPNNICCFDNVQDVIKIAKDNKLDYVVTPCINCRLNLANAGQKVVMLSTLLLEAVTYKD